LKNEVKQKMVDASCSLSSTRAKNWSQSDSRTEFVC
jgi:hypothetical protein